MKLFVVVLFAAFSCAYGLNGLSNNLLEFLSLLPEDKLNDIYLKHVDDEDYKQFVAFVLSNEFQKLIYEAEAIPEYIAIIDYMEGSGMEAYEYINMIHEYLGMKPFPHPKGGLARQMKMSSRPMDEIIDEIREIMPKDEIASLNESLMKNSPDFKYFAERLETKELKDIMNNYYNNEDLQRIEKALNDAGLDSANLITFYMELCGFKTIG